MENKMFVSFKNISGPGLFYSFQVSPPTFPTVARWVFLLQRHISFWFLKYHSCKKVSLSLCPITQNLQEVTFFGDLEWLCVLQKIITCPSVLETKDRRSLKMARGECGSVHSSSFLFHPYSYCMLLTGSEDYGWTALEVDMKCECATWEFRMYLYVVRHLLWLLWDFIQLEHICIFKRPVDVNPVLFMC